MAHPEGVATRMKLTKKAVDRLPPAAAGQYLVRDAGAGAQQGFFVIVGTRTKTYTVQTDVRTAEGSKTIKRAIGRADEWDAADAREEARVRLGSLQTGAERATPRRGGLTLGMAWARYKAHLERRVAAGERSQRTVDGYDDCVTRLLKPWLGTPLRSLADRPTDVADRHEQLTREHGSYAANHAMRSLRAIYRHARRKDLERGLPTEPPTRGVEWNQEHRSQKGMALRDLAAWEAQRLRLPNPIRQEFHLMMLLSGSRPDALRRARAEHIDVRRRVLHMPKPKGGAKRAFDIPLSRPMLRSLWRARRASRLLQPGTPWLFAALDTPTGHITETKEKKLAKHGKALRETYRTVAAEVGLDVISAKLLMNHSLGGDVNSGYITRSALLPHLISQQERISERVVAALARTAR